MNVRKVRNSFAEVIRMDIAKITTKGQITIPVDIRRKLGLKDGDKIVFLEENGKVFFENAAEIAFNRIQKSFEGEAEKAGIEDEEDVVNMVKEIRKDRQRDK